MIEPNTFQLPNLVVDEYLATMPQAALRCYLLIIRKTKGWQKNKDRISRSQFEEYTGLPKSTVYEGLKWLEQNGLIQRHKGETQNQITEYQVSGPPDTGSEGVRPTGIRCPAHRNNKSH